MTTGPVVGALLLVLTVGAGCTPGPPTGATLPGPSASVVAVASAGPGGAPADPPALLVSSPAGVFITKAGAPLVWSVVATPPGDAHATVAVGPARAVLLVSADGAGRVTATVARLVADRLEVRWTAALPPVSGTTPLAGCVDESGHAVVIADRLLYLDGGRLAGAHDVPATAGRCQFAADGTVLYLAEVDHGVTAWPPPDGGSVVTSTRCDDFGLGGGWLACLRNDGHVAVARAGPWLAGRPAFTDPPGEPVAGPARQVVISADAGWLAAVALDGTAVALYRRTGDAFQAAGGFSLEPGEVILGFVAPGGGSP